MGEYDFYECARGGLGNWKAGKRDCMLCSNEAACQEETGMNDLRQSRHSRDRVQSGLRVAPREGYTPARIKSRRPSPADNESMAGRLVLNILASSLAAGGHEFGDFFDNHDFAAPKKEKS